MQRLGYDYQSLNKCVFSSMQAKSERKTSVQTESRNHYAKVNSVNFEVDPLFESKSQPLSTPYEQHQ